VINGISVVTCVYVNPEVDRFWIIDYRIYHQPTDGRQKQVRSCQGDVICIGHRPATPF
jgi:hypothetical protein